ncbi:MAG TPA: protein kinase [Pirellulales bacterium]|jgi:WD40 repeat protein/serine/threonine protein kinase
MGSDASDTNLDMSHSELRLSELLLEYEASLAADPHCPAPTPPLGLDPHLADQWRRGCALLRQLSRTFASAVPAADASVTNSNSLDLRTLAAQVGDGYKGPEIGTARSVARRSFASTETPTTICVDETKPAEIPRHIGRYSIWRVAGRGGIGVVYRAFDPLLGRMVALKVPRPETLSNADLRRRFLREAEVAGRLCHPGIVTVFEVRGDDSCCYIATEYCEGPTLAAWLRNRAEPLAPRESAELVSALAAAVQHAHSRGVLHRDIKPTNVMLEFSTTSRDQRDSVAGPARLVPKLGDFGMAKLQEQCGEETRYGTVIGTPEYMSPEQAQGRVEDLDATTDVYALGALLYRLLTGRPPFQGATDAATLHRVVYEEPLAPRRVRRDIPPDLEAICLKCLGKLPNERYATAHELAKDLGHFLAGQATIARPLRPWQRLAKWGRRRPAVAALTGTLTLLLFSLLAIALGYNRQLLLSHQREAIALAELQLQADINHRALWAADLAKAWEDMQKNRGAAVRQFFRNYASSSDKPLRETFASRLLQRHFDAGDQILYHHDGPVYAAEFSRDGRSIASAGADGQIRICDLASRNVLRVPRTGSAHSNEINCLAFSHNGLLLASGGDDGHVRIWDSRTGELIGDMSGDGREKLDICDVAFSPDDGMLAFACFDGKVHLRDTKDWQELSTSPLLHPSGVLDISFNGDGRQLATVCEDRHIRVWQIPAGTVERDLGMNPTKCVVATFAHHGPLLASADQQPAAIGLWDVAVGKRVSSLPFGIRWIHALDFSHDDHWLAFSNKDGVVGLFDLVRERFGPTLFTNADCLWTVRLSPLNNDFLLGGGDGSVRLMNFDRVTSRQSERTFGVPIAGIAFPAKQDAVVVRLADGTVQLWNQAMTKVRHQLQTQPVRDQQDLLALAPRGTLAATVCDDPCQIDIVDTTSGQVLRKLEGAAAEVMSLGFAPDGTRLATGHRGGELRLWDIATGQTVATVATGQISLYSVGFASNGRQIATAGANQLRLWDAETLVSTADPVVLVGEAYRLAFQPGGALIAANDADDLLLWNSQTLDLRRLPAHDAEISTIAFSPKGQMLVTGGKDGALWLWDLLTQRKIAALVSGDGTVSCAAFSADGQMLGAAVTAEHRPSYVRLWNLGHTDRSGESSATAIEPLPEDRPAAADRR